jgi:hypothetical protein
MVFANDVEAVANLFGEWQLLLSEKTLQDPTNRAAALVPSLNKFGAAV